MGPKGDPGPGGGGRGAEVSEFFGYFGAEVQTKCLNLVGTGGLWRCRSQGLWGTRSYLWEAGGFGKVALSISDFSGTGCGGNLV